MKFLIPMLEIRPATHAIRALLLFFTLMLGATTAGALPRDYFPAGEEQPASDEAWSELAKRFPLRVKKTKPVEPAASKSPPPSSATEIKPGLSYFRVHSIERDLEPLAAALDARATIVDLRFVQADEQESLDLAAVLAQDRIELVLGGEPEGGPLTIEPAEIEKEPRGMTLVLTNRATAGPIESVLAALQKSGGVLLVGEKTKGDTGRFEPVAGHPCWQIIESDFRAPDGASLLDEGVTPDLAVTVNPVDDETAYRAFDSGTPLTALLDSDIEKTRFDEARLLQQHDRANGGSPALAPPSRDGNRDRSAEPEAADAKPAPIDKILHRAVNTVVTLRALRRFSDT
ncbi:MAG: S41 family peptidase [Opitutaceae bacterium]